MFRGISPLDATYKLSDLASHVFEMIPTITQEPCAGQQDIITNFIDNFGDHLEDRDIDVAAIEKDCDLPHNFVDDGSVEKKFRICVYKEYIWSRKKALDSILDGLQLLGKLCQRFLRNEFALFLTISTKRFCQT